ncbi:hypothetical protein ABEF92_000649 [Exophiala dermatitidis]|uniref:Uncharacterized protein n=1 Tax=Exophiala dermatitidis (strain ATCC 34100 / CBS 525.76 / NIH/UT8656) TaxID=858893 RepID=H6BTT4_EXODN|nr:uncharacterized protein HMPREF1120_03645 [Exophiala dermatitidis NIH/UT8656]EHY55511.1 hypothetical protein HMPREF1120_03645 [Exophiala dermatitidis NIH/UT8656]
MNGLVPLPGSRGSLSVVSITRSWLLILPGPCVAAGYGNPHGDDDSSFQMDMPTAPWQPASCFWIFQANTGNEPDVLCHLVSREVQGDNTMPVSSLSYLNNCELESRIVTRKLMQLSAYPCYSNNGSKVTHTPNTMDF